MGHSRRFDHPLATSDLAAEADILATNRLVSKVPVADKHCAARGSFGDIRAAQAFGIFLQE